MMASVKGVSSEPWCLDSPGFAFRYYPTGIQSFFHRIHPHSSSRGTGDFGGGGETWLKNELKNLHIGELITF